MDLETAAGLETATGLETAAGTGTAARIDAKITRLRECRLRRLLRMGLEIAARI
jgi:hypothetical protein